jgi:S1-C subfamily serine protease
LNSRRLAWIAGLGCTALILIVLIGLGGLLFFATGIGDVFQAEGQATLQAAKATTQEAGAAPTSTPALVQATEETTREGMPQGSTTAKPEEGTLASLYQDVNPGVVNIRVYMERAGMTGAGAGSGFILDDEGHIVTNHHVVADADLVTVIFYNGTEVEAEIIGTDADSDLAVVKVDQLPEGAHSLPLGASSAISPGDWVIAIGNPFSLGSSMTLGIVSAIGRTIPTAETPFSIPSAIQTDAAINPGNSGGPLLTMDGQVVGVNAQIDSTTGANTGVGFAISSDVVSLVAPALIEDGSYTWPWLGVTGTDVSLLVQEANDLPTQDGAYIVEVVENGPAAEAGLQGATGEREILGQTMPTGGDVVLEANGESIKNFTDLLTTVAFKRPGDSLELTILRDGEQRQMTVELAERPTSLSG